jgi:hypothetical protein
MIMRLRAERGLLRLFGAGIGECAYVAFRPHGPGFQVEFPSDWHEYRRGWVRIDLLLFTIAFSFPWSKTVPDDGQCSGPTYGFSYREKQLWIYRGKSTSYKGAWTVIHMPWDWKHFQSRWLNPDGSVHHVASRGEYEAPAETRQEFPYRYVMANGTVQDRIASIHGEDMEWRWYYFMRLPWPRMRKRSINIRFNDETGERTGSWNGGTIGCSWEWLRGETMEQSLRRMERERRL